MQIPDIHIVIAELSGLYDELNRRWGNDTCATDAYQVYRQKEYRDAYERLKEVNIESIALKIIADSIRDKVLSRLRGLLAENKRIYETRQDDFYNIEFDKLYQLWEDHLFAHKRALLLADKETIKDYPYPSEREREMLLKENHQDINTLDNERYELRRADALWISKNYYEPIYELSRSFASILDSYFPVPTKGETIEVERTPIPEVPQSINGVDSDEIFRTDMFEKLQEVEQRMMAEKYLDGNLNWLPRHKNDRPDLQRLVVFLVRLIENDYFLPYKDVKMREFFENRYHIKIGQNFERKRREKIAKENPYTFKEVLF